MSIIIKLKEVVVVIDYTPFWDTLKRKQLNQYKLLQTGDFWNTKLLWKLRKNENLNIMTIEQICKRLDCKITDVVTFTDEVEQ